MSDFIPWWKDLSPLLKIYWTIAIPFSIFFSLYLFRSFLRGTDVADATRKVAADHSVAFKFLTLQNILAFFTISGWIGIASIDAGLNEMASLLVAFVSGLATMITIATLFYFIRRAAADGSMKFSNAIGRSGEVHLTIQRKRGNVGKVQIKVQRAFHTLEAITDDEEDIPNGKTVKILSIVSDRILLVTFKDQSK